MYAVIRVRGNVNLSPRVKKTLELLNLTRANHASIWKEDKSAEKMLKAVENYVTYGEMSEEVLKELVEKRGNYVEGSDAKKAMAALKEGKSAKEAGVKNCFRLSPPKKGYERKGIKKPYSRGGALGYRKNEIDALIRKMI